MPETAGEVSRTIDRRMALAREWDELVEEVRKLDDFKDFLRPPRLEMLLPAAADGPVVIVNVSRWRCDALVVRTSGVEVVNLPSLTLRAVVGQTNEYLRVLQEVDQATYILHQARRRYDDGDRSLDSIRRYTAAKQSWQRAAGERDRTLTTTLRWLWDQIAEPVLACLGFVATPADGAWPRMWWCPTGPLTLMPLHAAGYHDPTDTPAGRTVLDRVVSSYTPTLRALLEARRPLGSPPAEARMLVVALADTPDEVPLAAVKRERDVLVSHFSPRTTLLEGAMATAAVRDELARHRWAHFSCHGSQNMADPSQGGLRLHDGSTLSIAEISARQHDGEFAFLSACMTAVGGVDLPDEVITLTAALHYTGYRQVIGTLWSVYDDTAADVAELVYDDLMSDGTFAPARSAHALHGALRHLRDVRGLPASAWSPFTHTGP
ncbi:CHAT domain-containing protein [Micromonospora sp. WMMC415]|uniref:CHAT domain-containing protein n=1 Tax=Micromonospora sp. WMMC415 TaxID=2675222 RepID=UPI0012B45DF5|nr:CHAT domain-containing protein [Micromonospora sp. WMMC415]QGN48117.1 CHAT domain-containing protein [Micromonospora sp. WMMC415]